MEIRNLNTFLKVTELKSFSKAAEALDYSQSAVTVQIQQLERELGVQLFDRIGKSVSITQYGTDFVAYARDVVSAVSRASTFATENKDLTGTVRVGTLDSLMTVSFADIVPAFHERFPHVVTRIHCDNAARLKELLIKNEIDLVYTLDEQLHDAQFAKVFEAEDEIVVVTNVENPLAKRVSVSLFDLVGHPFVMMNRNNPYRDRFDLELAHHDLAIEPFCELESDVLVIKLLSANPQYLSVLPRYAVEKSIHRERLAALPVAGCVMRQWRQLLYHKNKVITPQIQGMLDTIATCCKRV
ncbi:MAG: LysR family transcriptional regulator [Oscillospiraceae bacterium]|nr:LysR family transcriptional regulator [Oscillospiraceae bacterium]